MNNDLTGGIPDALLKSNIPIFPSIHAGWHARHKSEHFRHANALIQEFSKIVNIDPWQFLCLYELVDNVDIQKTEDLKRLYQAGVKLRSFECLRYRLIHKGKGIARDRC